MSYSPKILWTVTEDSGHARVLSPNPKFYSEIGFPPPWPDRPWIIGNMVRSQNHVVAWERKGDDPVLEILGIGKNSPLTMRLITDRLADQLHMRLLRTLGASSIGAETVRSQPELIQTPWEPGKDDAPELVEAAKSLYAEREANGLPHHPINVIYSMSGNMNVEETDNEGKKTGRVVNHLESHPIFHTKGLQAIIVTTEAGRERLQNDGVEKTSAIMLVETSLDNAGMVRAHQRLSAEHGVRYLTCEGGETILTSLKAAGLLDEIFVTTTDVEIEISRHKGVIRNDVTGARRIAEGKIFPNGYTFGRFRFNDPVA